MRTITKFHRRTKKGHRKAKRNVSRRSKDFL
jgi:hypothetical protein